MIWVTTWTIPRQIIMCWQLIKPLVIRYKNNREDEYRVIQI